LQYPHKQPVDFQQNKEAISRSSAAKGNSLKQFFNTFEKVSGKTGVVFPVSPFSAAI